MKTIFNKSLDLQDMKNDNEEKDEIIKKYIELTYIYFNIDLRKI